MSIDTTDQAILRLLQREAQITAADLAQRVALSASQAARRRQRLEAEGYVTGYRAELSPEKLGLNVEAFIQVVMATHTAENAKDFLRVTRNPGRDRRRVDPDGRGGLPATRLLRRSGGGEPAGAKRAAAASRGQPGADTDRDGAGEGGRAAADLNGAPAYAGCASRAATNCSNVCRQSSEIACASSSG